MRGVAAASEFPQQLISERGVWKNSLQGVDSTSGTATHKEGCGKQRVQPASEQHERLAAIERKLDLLNSHLQNVLCEASFSTCATRTSTQSIKHSCWSEVTAAKVLAQERLGKPARARLEEDLEVTELRRAGTAPTENSNSSCSSRSCVSNPAAGRDARKEALEEIVRTASREVARHRHEQVPSPDEGTSQAKFAWSQAGSMKSSQHSIQPVAPGGSWAGRRGSKKVSPCPVEKVRSAPVMIPPEVPKHITSPSGSNSSPKSCTTSGRRLPWLLDRTEARKTSVTSGSSLRDKFHMRWVEMGQCEKQMPDWLKRQRHPLQQQIYEAMEDPTSSAPALRVARGMQIFVLTTAVFSLLQTLKEPVVYGMPAAVIEIGVECIYAVELLMRFAVYPHRGNFFWILYNWIDILSVLPLVVRGAIGFVLPHPSEETWASQLLFCVVPVLRLLKILRHFETFHLLMSAFTQAFEALPMLLYTMMLLNLAFSALIYMVEPRDNIESLPAAAWFSIVTMTTVGYGDMTPVSPAGYAITSGFIVIAMLFMAVPIGIIGGAFQEVWGLRERSLLIARTRMALHKWGYKASDITLLFRMMDADGNGTVSVDEFTELFTEMKIGLSHERLVALYNYLEMEAGAELGYQDFVREFFPQTYQSVRCRISHRPEAKEVM